ncbi:DcaP family trimeric outer membrane transporter [Azospirillum melinis]
MQHDFCAVSVCIAGVLAVVTPSVARADQITDLKKQIEQLRQQNQEQIDALSRELQGAVRNQKEIEQKQAKVAATGPGAGSEPRSWLVPGTDLSIRIGGYAKGDFIYDVKGANGDVANATAVPIDGTPAANKRGATRIHAKQSRLELEAFAPTDFGKFHAKTVVDFMGTLTNTSQVASNSEGLRLREFYGELGPFLVGQTWSNFQDGAAQGEVIDGGPLPGQTLNRVPQFRYTTAAGGGSLVMTVENPESDFKCYSGPTGICTTPTNGARSGGGIGLSQIPVFVGRYTLPVGPGELTVAGMYRQIRAEDGNGHHARANGYGLLAAGSFTVFGKDKIYGQVMGGDGIGMYASDLANLSAAYDGRGRMDTLSGISGFVGYRHYWLDNLRSTVQAGYTRLLDTSSILPASTPGYVRETQSLHANLIWRPYERVDLGVENILERLKLVSGKQGTMERIQVGAWYYF